MTSENVPRRRSLLTRFAYMPGSLTDEELGALQRTYGGPWLGDHGQQIASEGLPLRGLHQRIAAEQLRRKLAKEAASTNGESAVPLGELMSLLNDMPEELTDQQLDYMRRSYPPWWISEINERIVAEIDRRLDAKEAEMLEHMDHLVRRLVDAPETLAPDELAELERNHRAYADWARGRAIQERERREGETETVAVSDPGERADLVRVGDVRFAIVQGYNDGTLFSAVNLHSMMIGHVSTFANRPERALCMTCNRRDCIHVVAVRRLLGSRGGAHGDE